MYEEPIARVESHISSGAEPLVEVLFTCLSKAVDDQLRIGRDFSVLTTLVTTEAVIPCSLQ